MPIKLFSDPQIFLGETSRSEEHPCHWLPLALGKSLNIGLISLLEIEDNKIIFTYHYKN